MKKLNNDIWHSAATQSDEQKVKNQNSKFAWCLTGSGHYLKESIQLLDKMPDTDIFLSKAAEEVLPMYGYRLDDIKLKHKLFRDKTYSSVPVGALYKNGYHTVIIAPATSNTVVKCALGISDTLPTNMFAQAGKLKIETIVFACDTEPTVITESPKEWVELTPRKVEFDNLALLKNFEECTVVETVSDLQVILDKRLKQFGLNWIEFSS